MPAQTVTEATILQQLRLAWISQLTNLKRPEFIQHSPFPSNAEGDWITDRHID